jgi:hypothetical protein
MSRETQAAGLGPETIDHEVARPAEFMANVRLRLEHRDLLAVPRDDAVLGGDGQKLFVTTGGSPVDW